MRVLEAAVAIGLAACTFPDIQLDGTEAASSASTAASPSSTSASTESGSGGAGGVGGLTGGGGNPDPSSSSSGGQSGGGGAGGSGCGGCDVDCDMHDSLACAGDDCDDHDARVYPGQTKWFETPRPKGGFDYDCNGAPQQEFATFACSGTVCANMNAVFLSVAPVECGTSAPFGNCALLLCAVTITDTKVVRCH